MRKVLIIAITVLITNLTTNGQNLFLIGERSYPCTSVITLVSNSDDQYDLDVFLAKDGQTGLFAVSRESIGDQVFTGKLIIYLKDGNVITCISSEASEKVDDHAKAVYYLTTDQLNQLKASDIHTVKFTLRWLVEDNYSASNRGVETSVLINEFFRAKGNAAITIDDPLMQPDSPAMDSAKKSDEGYDPFGDGSFSEGTGTQQSNERSNTGIGQNGKGIQWGDFAGDGLFNRKVVKRSNVSAITSKPGKVVVDLCVDRFGKVIWAKFDAVNSSIKDPTVDTKAVDCAKQYVFDKNPSAPREQCGRLTFIFESKK